MTNYDVDIEKALSNGFKGQKQVYTRDLTPEQMKTLRAYKEYYENKPSPRGGRIKKASVWNAILCLRRLGQFLEKPYKPINDQEMQEYTEKIVEFVSSLGSDSTRANWKVIIRSFYKWMYSIKDSRTFPKVVDDERLVPERPKSNKRPQDLPTLEDIEKMLFACYDDRDKAMVMLWSEMGGRGGEVASSTLSDIEFDAKGCKFWVDKSKSDRRFVRLIKSAPYLRNWINKIHPDRKNSKAPLFTAKAGGGYYGKGLDRNGLNQAIQRIAKRAGITKRIYWHLGRSYAITNLQRKGFDLVKNARRHGITTNTLQNVYLKLDDKDIDDAYCDLHDVRTEEEAIQQQKELDAFKPKLCPKCSHINPADLIFCEQEGCSAPLDLMTAMKIDENSQNKEQELQERLDKVEEVLGQVAKNLPQPIPVQYGKNHAILSISGLQPFNQEFKQFKKKQKEM